MAVRFETGETTTWEVDGVGSWTTEINATIGFPSVLRELFEATEFSPDGGGLADTTFSQIDNSLGGGWVSGNGLVGSNGSFHFNPATNEFGLELGIERGLIGGEVSLAGTYDASTGRLYLDELTDVQAFAGINIILGDQKEFLGVTIGNEANIQAGIFFNADKTETDFYPGARISYSHGLVVGKIENIVSWDGTHVSQLTADSAVEIFDALRHSDLGDAFFESYFDRSIVPLLKHLKDRYERQRAIRGIIESIGDGGCFLPGTTIAMWDGAEKPIEEVAVDDWVISYDQNGIKKPGRVTRTFQHAAQYILDFHGTYVTPGHAYFCADGKFKNQYVTLLDILRSDGAVEASDGRLIRAATNEPVGSLADQFVQVVSSPLENGNISATTPSKIRLGTKVSLVDGSSVSFIDYLESRFGVIAPDGQIKSGRNIFSEVLYWPFGKELPKPEDYVLTQSAVTLEDIFAAPWLEAHKPRLGAPYTGEAGPSYMPGHKAIRDQPRNVPLSLRQLEKEFVSARSAGARNPISVDGSASDGIVDGLQWSEVHSEGSRGHTVTLGSTEAGFHWQTYNFEVDEHHTYVADGIRVHNDSFLWGSVLPNGDWASVTFDEKTGRIRTSIAEWDKGSVSFVDKWITEDGIVDAFAEITQEYQIPIFGSAASPEQIEAFFKKGVFGNQFGDKKLDLQAEYLETVFENYIRDEKIIATAGGIGQIFGAQLGRQLAGDNPVAGVVLGGVLGAIGQTLFEVVGSAFTSYSVLDVIQDFDENLAEGLKGAGIGAVSSFLAAELIGGLGVDGFAGDLATTAGGAVISQVIENIPNIGDPIFEVVNGVETTNQIGTVGAFDGVAGAAANAVAGFLGNQLGRAVINIDSVEGQIGASVGSSVGVLAAKVIFSANPVGIFIGAFIGTVLGGLIGNSLGGPARAGAMFLYNPSRDRFRTTSVWGKNGGDAESAKSIADVVTVSLNDLLTAVGGEVVGGEYLHGNNTPLNGQIDIKNGQLRYRTWDRPTGELTEKKEFNDTESFVEHSVFRMLRDMEIAGGDVYVKRALYRTLELVTDASGDVSAEDALQTLSGNLSFAADYSVYAENESLLNTLMSTQPDSAFTAGWIITLVAADELGLNRRHWADHMGGWNYLLKDKEFESIGATLVGFESVDARSADVVLDFNELSNERVIKVTKANGQIETIRDLVLGSNKTEIQFVNAAAEASDFSLVTGHEPPTGLAKFDAIVAFALNQSNGSLEPYSDYLSEIYGTDFDPVDAQWADQVDRLELSGDVASTLALVRSIMDDEYENANISASLVNRLNTLETKLAALEAAAGGSNQTAITNALNGVANALDPILTHADYYFERDPVYDVYNVFDEDDFLAAAEGAVALVLRGTDGADSISAFDPVSGEIDPESGLGDLFDLGNDIFGGAGNDTLQGGANADWIYGEGGHDQLYAIGGNNNMLDGGVGNDWLHGSNGDATIAAKKGSDWLIGGDGNDRLFGNRGEDILTGGAGNDVLRGGAHADTYIFNRGDGQGNWIYEVASENEDTADYDVIEIGQGVTLADIQIARLDNPNDITVEDGDVLDANGKHLVIKILGQDGAPDDVLTIANWYEVDKRVEILRMSDGTEIEIGNFASFIVGTSGDDALDGDDNSNFIHGGQGNDTINAYGGDDVAIGGRGHDAVFGGSENDLVIGADGDDYLEGNAGADVLTGDKGVDILYGGAGTDTLAGGRGNDIIVTGGGNDRILYGFGDGQDIVYDEFGGAAVLVYRDGNSKDDFVDPVASVGETDAPTFEHVSINNLNQIFDTMPGGEGQPSTVYELKDGFYIKRIRDDQGTPDESDDKFVTEIYNYQDTGTGNSNAGADDRVEFKYGVKLENIRILEGGTLSNTSVGGDLVIGLDTAFGTERSNDELDDTLRFADWFENSGGASIEVFDFAGRTPYAEDGLTFVSAIGFWGAGTDGDDDITGVNNYNWITGATGNDALTGNGYIDILNGGSGNDTLKGGGTNIAGYGDLLIGGNGLDVADFDGSAAAVIVNLATGVNTGGAATDDILISIEGVFGSAHGDTLIGDDYGNEFKGNGGDDFLSGGLDDDDYYFNLGDGNDKISERNGNTDAGLDEWDWGFDTLNFGEGIGIGDLDFAKVGADLEIGLDGQPSDSITIQGWYADSRNIVESFVFSDGQVISVYNQDDDNPGIDNLLAPVLNTTNATTGNDWLTGTAAGDTIDGGEGRDVLGGRSGDDSLSGGAGDDTLAGGAGADTLDGGDGIDFVNYVGLGDTSSGAGVNVNLETGIVSGQDSDTILNVENVTGTLANDFILGSAADNDLSGSDGDDTVSGGDGADVINGGIGADLLDGGAGSDAVLGGWHADTVSGGDGNDSLYGGGHGDSLYGDAGDDYVAGQGGADLLLGGDSLASGAFTGHDTLDGGSGKDTLKGGDGGDVLFGSDGDDQLFGEEGDDNLYGGKGDDQLQGGLGNDIYLIARDAGHDTITEVDETQTINRLIFADNVEAFGYRELWFSRQNNSDNLLVQVIGSDASVTVTDWFSGADPHPTKSMRAIEIFSGAALYREHVQYLIDVMAGPLPETVESVADVSDEVTAVQDAYWFAGGRTPPEILDTFENGDGETVTGAQISVNEDFAVFHDLTVRDIDENIVSIETVNGDGPVNGRVFVLNTEGQFVYIPNPNYFGSDAFSLVVTDADGQSATAKIEVTVNSVNDNPIAGDVVVYTLEDYAASAQITFEDADLHQNITLRVSDAVQNLGNNTYETMHGTVVLEVVDGVFTGNFEYTPDANYEGTEFFHIEASDPDGAFDIGLVGVKVFGFNDAPEAVDLELTTDEDRIQTGYVAASDVEGDTLIYSLDVAAAKGDVVVDSLTGIYTYTPNADATGADSFQVAVDDGTDITLVTVNVTINAVDDAAVTDQQVYGLTVAEDATATQFVVSATDIEGDGLVFEIQNNAAHGTVTLESVAPDGANAGQVNATLSYTPNADYNGADSITLLVKDSGGTLQDTITIAVTVTEETTPLDTGANDAPFVVSVEDVDIIGDEAVDLATDEDTPHEFSILARDPDSDALTYTVLTAPTNGTVDVANGTDIGRFVYTPDADYNGADSAVIEVSDGTLTDTITLNFTVAAVNDAPVAPIPTLITVDEDSSAPYAGAISATDPEGEALTYELVPLDPADPLTFAAHGSITLNPDGTFEYEPDTDFHGADQFTVKVTDAAGGSTYVTVPIQVTPVNDKPVGIRFIDLNAEAELTTIDITENLTGSDIAIVLVEDVDDDMFSFDIDDFPFDIDDARFTIERRDRIVFENQQWHEYVLRLADGVALDRESDGASVTFELTATDEASSLDPSDRATNLKEHTQSVTLNVVNENEAPTIDDLTGPAVVDGVPFTLDIAEGETAGVVATIHFDDVDMAHDPAEFVFMEILEGDTNLFTLDFNPGVNPNEAIIHTRQDGLTSANKLDYETETQHELVVQVRDRLGRLNRQTIVVNVENVDEGPVAVSFTDAEGNATASFSLDENNAAGTVIGYAQGQDASEEDSASGWTYDFASLAAYKNGSQVSVDIAQIVKINSVTGAISVDAPMDFETYDQVKFVVRATDGVETQLYYDSDTPEDVGPTVLTVGNVNEAPTLENGSTVTRQINEHSRLEEAAYGDVVNNDIDEGLGTKSVLSLDFDSYFSDPEGDGLTYEIIGGQSEREIFKIDSDGKLYVVDELGLNHEDRTQVNLTVRAQDVHRNAQNINVTINIEDLRDRDYYAGDLDNAPSTVGTVSAGTGYYLSTEDVGTVVPILVHKLYRVVDGGPDFVAAQLNPYFINDPNLYEYYADSYSPAWGAVYRFIDDPAFVAIDYTLDDSNNNVTGNGNNNALWGKGGNDTLSGAAGQDLLLGDTGHDSLSGGTGVDTLEGGTGNDTLLGGDGNDKLYGDAGHDSLLGGNNNDQLSGNAGNDILKGDAGHDTLWGGDGNDVLHGGAWNDTIYGQDGVDVLDYSSVGAGVVVDMSIGRATDDGGGSVDTFSGIENILGSAHADSVTGDNQANNLQGGGGHDTLSGGDGNDTLLGGANNDQLFGNGGHDVLYGDGNNDTIDGGAGNDQLFGGDGQDSLIGGDGADQLEGNAGDDTLNGGTGDDTLIGGDGADVLDGGDGFDIASYADATGGITVVMHTPTLSGGIATGDTYVNVEGVAGSGSADNLTGDAGNNILDGGAGDDSLNGYLGDDTLIGGLGADLLDGGDGIDFASYAHVAEAIQVSLGAATLNSGEAVGDTYSNVEGLIGSGFDDTLSGDAGDNVLDGNGGNDVLSGGLGNDSYILTAGSGRDTISEAADDGAGTPLDGGAGDAILLGTKADGSDIALSDLLITRLGDDVEVRIKGEYDRVRIANWYEAGGFERVEKLVFADGSEVTLNAGTINEFAPSAIEDNVFVISENSGAHTFSDWVTVTDLDGNAETLSFEIISGNHNNLFSIDAVTGELSVAGDLDYEYFTGLPSAIHQIGLRITDSGGLTYDEGTVGIQVLDVDEAPELLGPSDLNWDENRSGPMITLQSNLHDDVPHIWSITAGNDYGFFVIDPATGQISVMDPGLSFEEYASHILTVKVQDTADDTGFSDSTTITINVNDLEETPTIEIADAAIDENLFDTIVAPITIADDDDINEILTLSILSGNDSGLFVLDTINNVIKTSDTLEVSYEDGASYTLSVQVEDSTGLNATTDVTITVNDVDEAPVLDDQTLDYDENIVGGVIDTLAFDPRDAGVTHYWAITAGNDAGLFAIDDDGQISLVDPNSLDYETATSYALTVEVRDTLDGTGLSDTANVTINVNNLYEFAPVATPLTPSVAENFAGSLGTLSVTDADIGDDLSYAITAGDTSLFSIDADTGELFLDVARDFESVVGPYNLDIEITDLGGNTTTTTAQVTISDANDAPVLSNFSGSINENTTGLVGTVSASDEDAGDSLSYDITAGNTGDIFSINGAGQISLNSARNYEAGPTSYNLTIEATDAGGLTDTASAAIAINNVNEAITLSTSSVSKSIKENSQQLPSNWGGGWVAGASGIGTNVLNVSGYFNDPDGASIAQYRISNQEYSGAFKIDNNGLIEVNSNTLLDYDTAAKRNQWIDVQAKDPQTGAWSSALRVNVNLTDLADHEATAWWQYTSPNAYNAGQALEGHTVTYTSVHHGAGYLTYEWTVKNSAGSTIMWTKDDNWTSGGDGFWMSSSYKTVGWGGSNPGWAVTFLTPVVFDLDGDGAELVRFQDSQVAFDMDGDGVLERTGWAGADDGMLALDRNGDGVIGDGSEISFVQDLEGATTDMEGLVAFDTNGDGQLSALDAAYDEFLVWQDRNQDGISQADELLSLEEAGIASIGLELDSTGQTTEGATDNVVFNTAWYESVDGTKGEIADSAFAYEDQAAGSIADEDVAKLIQAMASFGGPSGIDLDLKDKTFGQEQNPASTLAVQPYI